MKTVLTPFCVLALIGLLLAIGADTWALLGHPIPEDFLTVLNFGIFFIGIPAVVLAIQANRFAYRHEFWKVAFSGCPPRLRTVIYGISFAALLLSILSRWFAISSAKDVFVSSGLIFFYVTNFGILYSIIRAPHLLVIHRCKNGHQVSPIAQFCPECGSAVPEIKLDEDESPPRECGACGLTLKPDRADCHWCGWVPKTKS